MLYATVQYLTHNGENNGFRNGTTNSHFFALLNKINILVIMAVLKMDSTALLCTILKKIIGLVVPFNNSVIQ